jgi:hypothetical protein
MKKKPIYVKQCTHDLAERETACYADGLCPICLLDTVVIQRASIMTELQASEKLCKIYSDIAVAAIGEEEVRTKRDAMIKKIGKKKKQ